MKEKALNQGMKELVDALEAYVTDDVHAVISTLVGIGDIDPDNEQQTEILLKTQDILRHFSEEKALGLVRAAMSFYNGKMEYELYLLEQKKLH